VNNEVWVARIGQHPVQRGGETQAAIGLAQEQHAPVTAHVAPRETPLDLRRSKLGNWNNSCVQSVIGVGPPFGFWVSFKQLNLKRLSGRTPILFQSGREICGLAAWLCWELHTLPHSVRSLLKAMTYDVSAHLLPTAINRQMQNLTPVVWTEAHPTLDFRHRDFIQSHSLGVCVVSTAWVAVAPELPPAPYRDQLDSVRNREAVSAFIFYWP